MSWDPFVNDQLIGTGVVSKAAICGLDGAIWAKSANFNISEAEAAAAAKAYAAPDVAQSNGLKFEGEKYFMLNANDERMIGKKGANGFFTYKTKQAVIISVYEGGMQPEACSQATGKLADYFKSINY